MRQSMKMNNKGFSLVELLVALAISGIILAAVAMLVTNGVSGYRKQTTIATLQDDANVTINHISNAVMESNVINLENAQANKNYTKEFSTNDGSSTIASNVYIYKPDDQTIYVTDKDKEELSPLCTNVTNFLVQVTSTSLKSADGGNQYVSGNANPMQFKVTITLEIGNETRTINRIVNARNNMNCSTRDGATANFTIEGKALLRPEDTASNDTGLTYFSTLNAKSYIAE